MHSTRQGPAREGDMSVDPDRAKLGLRRVHTSNIASPVNCLTKKLGI